MTRKAGEEVASPAFYAQGCVWKSIALLYAPRAAGREKTSLPGSLKQFRFYRRKRKWIKDYLHQNL